MILAEKNTSKKPKVTIMEKRCDYVLFDFSSFDGSKHDETMMEMI